MRHTQMGLIISLATGEFAEMITVCPRLREIPIVSRKLPVGLTHSGRVTHICVGKLIIIGSDNGLSPDRRQAII